MRVFGFRRNFIMVKERNMQNECIFVQHFGSNSPKYHVKEDYYEGNFKVRGQGSQRNSPAVHMLHGAQETLLH